MLNEADERRALTKASTAEAEKSALRLRETEVLPELKARAFERLEASLAALTHIAAHQAKMANWWNRRLDAATREAERLEADPDHPRHESSMKRVRDIVESQGRAFDRIMKAADQAVVVARALGHDVGEALTPLPVGLTAEDGATGRKVDVKGVEPAGSKASSPPKSKVYRFARSSGTEGAAPAAGEAEAASEAAGA